MLDLLRARRNSIFFMSADKSPSGVYSVRVALDTPEAVAFSEEGIGVSEIAAGLGLAKTTAFRHLHTLVDRGYVVRHSTTARYQIGIKFQLLSRFGPNGNNLIAAGEQFVSALLKAAGLSINLGNRNLSKVAAGPPVPDPIRRRCLLRVPS